MCHLSMEVSDKFDANQMYIQMYISTFNSGVWLSRPPNRKFWPYTAYTYAGKIKVNHN